MPRAQPWLSLAFLGFPWLPLAFRARPPWLLLAFGAIPPWLSLAFSTARGWLSLAFCARRAASVHEAAACSGRPRRARRRKRARQDFNFFQHRRCEALRASATARRRQPPGVQKVNKGQQTSTSVNNGKHRRRASAPPSPSRGGRACRRISADPAVFKAAATGPYITSCRRHPRRHSRKGKKSTNDIHVLFQTSRTRLPFFRMLLLSPQAPIDEILRQDRSSDASAAAPTRGHALPPCGSPWRAGRRAPCTPRRRG